MTETMTEDKTEAKIEAVLYSFRRCPYAIRARMALAYAGISCELRELILKDKPADMLAHSPKGTVPVLITAQNQVIDESIDVMHWALKQHDPENWLADHEVGLVQVAAFEREFKHLLDRYKYADRHPELSPNEHRANTEPMITDLNDQLKAQSFLLGEQMTLVDVALFPFIRQYAHVDKKWFDQLPVPHLQRWLSHFLHSPLFQVVMTKFKLFNDGFVYEFPSARLLKSP